MVVLAIIVLVLVMAAVVGVAGPRRLQRRPAPRVAVMESKHRRT